MSELEIERMNPPKIHVSDRPYVLVALCFLGVPCRYHGQLTKMGYEIFKKKMILELSEQYNILPLCGEQIGGLPTPREPCEVKNGKVKVRKGRKDFTEEYQKGAREVLRLCRMFQVKKAYLVKDSPMCGKGYGVLANLLEEEGIFVYKI
jgi:uncharacterized protein YbbK (DUF523 family)